MCIRSSKKMSSVVAVVDWTSLENSRKSVQKFVPIKRLPSKRTTKFSEISRRWSVDSEVSTSSLLLPQKHPSFKLARAQNYAFKHLKTACRSLLTIGHKFHERSWTSSALQRSKAVAVMRFGREDIDAFGIWRRFQFVARDCLTNCAQTAKHDSLDPPQLAIEVMLSVLWETY